MKVIIFGITLILSLCICTHTKAQGVKKQGYIVLNNGDTLNGWINYRNWEKNPSTIGFLRDSTGGITDYSKHDVKAVEINGLDRYIKAIVVKDARPVTIGNLLPAEIDSLITDTVLLRILIKGSKLDLYELVDNKPHFFISNQDGEIKELIYKLVAIDNYNFSTRKLFINQLKAYIIGHMSATDLLKKINNANYTEKDLSRIVNEINKTSGTVEYTAANPNKKILTSFFAGAGGGFSNLRFNGTNSAFNNMQFSASFSPFATIGIEVSSPRSLQAITLRIEASFSHASYTATSKSSAGYSNSYSVSQTNISPTASLLFNFIRKESLKVYAGVSAALNIASYSKNQYIQTGLAGYERKIDNYVDLPKTWIAAPIFKLGTKLNNKISVEADGRFWGSMTDFISWSLTPQTVSCQVRYYF